MSPRASAKARHREANIKIEKKKTKKKHHDMT
jgi:hypothetical protein